MERVKIIIDTDPGQDIDDLLAIQFALLRPELQVMAITTSTWPTHKRGKLVRRLCRELGRADIPVAPGADYPLRDLPGDELERLHDVRVSMNHSCFAEPEDVLDDPDDIDAASLIVRAVNENPGEIVLACIAPLTNVALALRSCPEIVGKIKSIVMMGGETKLNRREHNVEFDYVAADEVLGSGVPIFMGTWDVTRRFSLSPEDCDLFRSSDSALYRSLADAIAKWHPVQNWKPGPVMYDIFPIVFSFDRSYYETEPLCVAVETEGKHSTGMTIPCPGAPNVEVTTGADVDALRRLYFSTVFPSR
ncbi:MAG: nucleoside hydrolase [Spirochaetaceae bacterium]|nr:MAG: nucleoside hydrolase [Spirochaetaceae bacterium]